MYIHTLVYIYTYIYIYQQTQNKEKGRLAIAFPAGEPAKVVAPGVLVRGQGLWMSYVNPRPLFHMGGCQNLILTTTHMKKFSTFLNSQAKPESSGKTPRPESPKHPKPYTLTPSTDNHKVLSPVNLEPQTLNLKPLTLEPYTPSPNTRAY